MENQAQNMTKNYVQQLKVVNFFDFFFMFIKLKSRRKFLSSIRVKPRVKATKREKQKESA